MKTVWVGNLGPHIAEQHLCDAFRPFGTITRCEVMRERGSRVSRGFGFLTFEYAPSAASARVYMNATVLPGFGDQPICVDFSNREKEAQHEQLAAWSARTGSSPQASAALPEVRSPVTPRALYNHRTSTFDGDTPLALFDGLTEGNGASRTLSADNEVFGELPAAACLSTCSREQLARAVESTRAALAGLVPTVVSRLSSATAPVSTSPQEVMARASSLLNAAAKAAEGVEEAGISAAVDVPAKESAVADEDVKTQ